MRLLIAVWISKFLIIVGRLLGKKGSSTPGIYAMKICPDILITHTREFPENIAVVMLEIHYQVIDILKQLRQLCARAVGFNAGMYIFLLQTPEKLQQLIMLQACLTARKGNTAATEKHHTASENFVLNFIN